jgi:putative NADH-flavin reductase
MERAHATDSTAPDFVRKKGLMNLLILGATGGVGQELVRQSLDHGHSVTAFVRSPERLATFGAHLKVVSGDLLNPDQLSHFLIGKNAVLSGFGPRQPLRQDEHDLLERFAQTLTRAMSASTCRRAVIVSTAFLFKDALFPPAHWFGRLFFPSVVKDATAMETIIRRSELDWTLVRPPQLTDKPLTAKYHQRETHLPRFGFKISRADTAHCMLRVTEDHTYSRKVVGVAN